jgi:hypothetical protein
MMSPESNPEPPSLVNAQPSPDASGSAQVCTDQRSHLLHIGEKNSSFQIVVRFCILQGMVIKQGQSEAALCETVVQQKDERQAVAMQTTSNVSSATLLSYMSCVDLPCRMDLSHIVALFTACAGDAPDISSRSKGQRKRPRPPATPCYRYGNYHR